MPLLEELFEGLREKYHRKFTEKPDAVILYSSENFSRLRAELTLIEIHPETEGVNAGGKIYLLLNRTGFKGTCGHIEKKNSLEEYYGVSNLRHFIGCVPNKPLAIITYNNKIFFSKEDYEKIGEKQLEEILNFLREEKEALFSDKEKIWLCIELIIKKKLEDGKAA